VEYAIWAVSTGDMATAARLEGEIEQTVRRWSRQTRALTMGTLLRRWQMAKGGIGKPDGCDLNCWTTLQTRQIAVAGAIIASSVGGVGPPVLLLHGFPQCRAMWARVAARSWPRDSPSFAQTCAATATRASRATCPTMRTTRFVRSPPTRLQLMRALGFERFHLVGHDRGARTAVRLALDHPAAVSTLTIMDIVPTHTLFMEANRKTAAAYWHWYFLALPEPFPERLIGNDPDFFYETCLTGWGAARLSDFDPQCLRRVSAQPGAIRP
jgi:haloacetate dehalogenase